MKTSVSQTTSDSQPETGPHEYMRAKEAADYYRVSLRHFARLKARGMVPFVMLSPGVILFRKSDLDRLMSRMTVRK